MGIEVQNNSIRSLSNISKYNNLQNTKSVFSNKLNSIGKSNNSVNTNGVKYGEDEEKVLIEDKKLYDYYGISNIEFGSKEWEKWKIENTNNFFPPLDAPVQVRQAWREVRESIPEDDKLALYNFTKRNMILACSIHYKDQFSTGLPSNFELNTPKDYEQLLDIDITRNNFFSEICAPSDKGLYINAVKLDEELKNKLHEVLFII